MTDIEIIKSVLIGWHLNGKELERAKQLIHTLNIYIKQQSE
jgi:hypothetical protein